MNTTSPSLEKSTVRQALEDFVVVGGLATVGSLIATSAAHVPSIDGVWGGLLAGAMAGLLAYARARQIQKAG